MNKKLVIYSILCLSSTLFTLSAQEKTKPFSHLGVGVGFGTAGLDIDFSTPLNDYFVLRAGLSTLPLGYSTSFDLNYDVAEMDALIQSNSSLRNKLSSQGLPTSTSAINQEIKMSADLGLLNGKILVDIHPFQNSGFHLTLGAYIGSDRLLTIKGTLPEQNRSFINLLNSYISNPDDHYTSSITLGDYQINATAGGSVEVGIQNAVIKPYAGLGFGRSIPRSRIGVQFEMGAYFHGTPKIVSSDSTIQDKINSELENSGITKLFEKMTVYPVISLKLTGRIL
jgi:hypothetical protein